MFIVFSSLSFSGLFQGSIFSSWLFDPSSCLVFCSYRLLFCYFVFFPPFHAPHRLLCSTQVPIISRIHTIQESHQSVQLSGFSAPLVQLSLLFPPLSFCCACLPGQPTSGFTGRTHHSLLLASAINSQWSPVSHVILAILWFPVADHLWSPWLSAVSGFPFASGSRCCQPALDFL